MGIPVGGANLGVTAALCGDGGDSLTSAKMQEKGTKAWGQETNKGPLFYFILFLKYFLPHVGSSLRHAGSLVAAYGLLVEACRI